MPNTNTKPGAEQAPEALVALSRRGFESLSAHVALVDERGEILLVNHSWSRFAAGSGGRADVAVGMNYLDVCRTAGDPDSTKAAAGIEAVLRGESPVFTMEYPCHGPGEWRWFLMTVAPLEGPGARGCVIEHRNITEQKHSEHALRASEQRFRAIFDNAALGVAEIAADGRWLCVNERLRQILGYSEQEFGVISLREMTHPDDRDAEAAHLEAMRMSASASYSLQRRFCRKDGGVVWLNSTLSAMRGADGQTVYYVGLFEDVSEHRQVELHLRTLLDEAAHRGKNLLAVIQSIAARSLVGKRTLGEAREAFEGRLHALARTYDALTDESQGGALLEPFLKDELASFADRATLEGPSVLLTARSAQTFALVIHELATNAVKYGALSVDAGRVSARWDVQEAAGRDMLVFEWREQHGPPAQVPARRGFGTTLLSQVAAAEFGCSPKLEYGEAGFAYRFEAPLARVGARLVDAPVRRRIKDARVCALYDAWARLRSAAGRLPPLAGFDWTNFSASGDLTIAACDGEGPVRFIRIGRSLLQQLELPLGQDDIGKFDAMGLADSYRRCARQGEPTHEYLRFDFGDGAPLTFERLLVPFAAGADGETSHVAGIVIYEGRPGGGAA